MGKTAFPKTPDCLSDFLQFSNRNSKEEKINIIGIKGRLGNLSNRYILFTPPKLVVNVHMSVGMHERMSTQTLECQNSLFLSHLPVTGGWGDGLQVNIHRQVLGYAEKVLLCLPVGSFEAFVALHALAKLQPLGLLFACR